ncbi:alpha/beta fold hydrolase [Kutzneria sp. CA-103260]|uniref:alpha/beta fold hydrolase n=1 Tax=Kutzneria sp. CA-103260 TaxID=2802641 RepID=UPI001BA9FD1A|nr:alpha/beta hydrolase [Kutzneria sp. CA-103260]QUQ65273.1 hydrolase [Kutzneria sp. CA-103260]
MNQVGLTEGYLAYDDVGDGPPVVFLHDGTLDRRVWDRQLLAFDEYRVLNLDARGHGESFTPTTPYWRGDDVIALLDQLNLPSAVLVGQSMGGTSALDIAMDLPDRVRGVVISGCGTSEQYWQSPFVVGLLKRQKAAALRCDTDAYIEMYLRLWVDGPAREPHEVCPSVRERCREMAMHTATRHARPDPVLPGKAVDTWARLPAINTPLLAVVGELDCSDVKEMVERVVSAVPNAKLEVFAGAGHMLNMEQPARFTHTVREFLDGLSGQPS